MSLKKLNYIGSKFSLLSFINNTIAKCTGCDNFRNKKIVDVFAGTSSVGFHFRKLGCNVISNDLEYYSYVIARASICCDFSVRIENIIKEFNLLDGVNGILTKNYAEDRKYFTVENGKIIDAMRLKLEEIKGTLLDDEYYFLLASIIVSADSIANVPSIYGSYLKQYKKTALKTMILEPIHREIEHHPDNRVYNEECLNLIDKLGKVDWVYMDPPYNERQYGKNYHVLNYIGRYDSEMEIYGKTGLIRETVLSDWCSRGKAEGMLERFMEKIGMKTDWVFMSYNNEGIIESDRIKEIFTKNCDMELVSMEYKRFKNFSYNDSGMTNENIWVGRY